MVPTIHHRMDLRQRWACDDAPVAQILRVIDSLQLTANHSVATPVNWKHGQDVVVVPGLTDDQAQAKVGARHHRRVKCEGSGTTLAT